MSVLSSVPDEVIAHILRYVPPEDNLLSVQLVSRRFRQLASSSLLWKHHCLRSFKYWAPQHRLRQKLAASAPDVQWKPLWIQRSMRQTLAARIFEEVLASNVGRLERFGRLCSLGQDTKDFLLEQRNTDDSAEDVLARRYYADLVLKSMRRALAVQEWDGQRTGGVTYLNLERTFVAFDMFVSHPDEGDMDDIIGLLDGFAAKFLSETHRAGEMTARQKAVALLRWVRAEFLTNVVDARPSYHVAIRTCLLGHALRGPGHPSLHIISCIIYCSIARRVGIRAGCCLVPNHCYALVFPPDGETLEGRKLMEAEGGGEAQPPMVLDPSGFEDEVSLDILRKSVARHLGLAGSQDIGQAMKNLLTPTRPAVLMLRIVRHLYAFTDLAGTLGRAPVAGGDRSFDRSLDYRELVYGLSWCQIALRHSPRRTSFAEIRDTFLTLTGNFPEDRWIIERYLPPICQEVEHGGPERPLRYYQDDIHLKLERGHPDSHLFVQRRDTLDICTSDRHAEHICTPVRPTAHLCNPHNPNVDRCTAVRYRVGHAFFHRRYGYVGIITGWASSTHGAKQLNCTTDGRWNSLPALDDPPAEEDKILCQPIYSCIERDLDDCIVTSENIRLITKPNDIPQDLYYHAGRFFKRFDHKTCSFVSNLREYYPDD